MPIRADARLLRALHGHTGAVYTLAPGLAPGHVLSAASDGVVAHWNLETGESEALLQAQAPVFSLWADAEAGLLVAGQMDGGIHFLDLGTRTVRKSAQAHEGSVFDLQPSPDGKLLLSAGQDGKTAFWNRETLALELTAQISKQSLRTLAFSPDGQLLATGASDGFIRIYTLASLKNLYTWQASERSVFRLQYHPTQPWLFSAGSDAQVHRWQVEEGYTRDDSLVAHLFAIHDLALSPDARHFATGSMDKHLKIWQTDTLRLMKVLEKNRDGGHSSSVNRALWLSPTTLVSCSDDSRLLHWEVIPRAEEEALA